MKFTLNVVSLNSKKTSHISIAHTISRKLESACLLPRFDSRYVHLIFGNISVNGVEKTFLILN